jgi:Suppressor of fused protein (SUFU)
MPARRLALEPDRIRLAKAGIFLANRGSTESREVCPSPEDMAFLGHTVEDSAPIDFVGRFTGVILLNPRTFPEGVDRVTTDEDGRTIHFFAAIPLLPQEMQFAQKLGSDTLEERLNDAGVTEHLNPQRPSVV